MNEVTSRDTPVRHDAGSQEGTWPQQFAIGNDETELELSVESRSFANWVNHQVRKKNNCQSIAKTTDLTLNQNCDTSMMSERMRSQDCKQLVGRIIHGNTCH